MEEAADKKGLGVTKEEEKIGACIIHIKEGADAEKKKNKEEEEKVGASIIHIKGADAEKKKNKEEEEEEKIGAFIIHIKGADAEKKKNKEEEEKIGASIIHIKGADAKKKMSKEEKEALKKKEDLQSLAWTVVYILVCGLVLGISLFLDRHTTLPARLTCQVSLSAFIAMVINILSFFLKLLVPSFRLRTLYCAPCRP
jgi:hypothetical protein